LSGCGFGWVGFVALHTGVDIDRFTNADEVGVARVCLCII